MIDRATVDRILDAANIVDVVSDFVTLKRAGANLKGLCPFHDDRTPSFMVSPSKNICKCFACGEGGTPVHFIMKHEQLSYPDALRYLAKKYHIEIKEREQTDEEKAEQSERESLFVVNEWANEWFQKQMNDTVDGRAVGLAYFRQRGFRDDLIKKFQLGFCPDKYDAQWQAAKAEGFNEDYILKTGLCIRNEQGKTYDRFRNRVIFPIHTISGKVVGFGGRVLDSRTKGVSIKYQNSPESVIYSKKRELYGLFFAKKAIVKEDLCYLVEGYTDVMAMHQQGVENVVASSGTALTHEQIRLIHRFTENITVIYDGDAAGIKASQRGIDMLLAEGMTVRLLLLPDGDDPDSFARKHTATEYQQYLAEHQVDFIRFKTDLLLNEAKGDPIKLSRLVNNIVDSLAVIPDEITRTFYIKETSQMLAIEERIITTAVAKVRAKMREEKNKEREREANRQQTTPDLAHPQQRSSASVTQDGLTFSQPVDSFATREGRGEAGAQPGATPERPTPNPSRQGGEASAQPTDIPAPDYQGGDADAEPAIGIGSLPLRGDLEGSFPFGRGGSSSEEEKILRTEALLVQMLIRHGEKVMCDVEDEETGEARPLKVAEFISFSLDQDSLHLHHPLHQRILQETLEHLNEEGFHCTRYFENHPDNDVATLSISLAHDPEALSKVHSKGLTIPPEEERLTELVPRLMTDYKLAIVKKAINGLRRQLADPAIKADKEHFAQLMQEFISTTQSLKELSKECGDRVIS